MSKNLNENQLFAIPLVAQGVSGKDIAKTLNRRNSFTMEKTA